MVRLDAGEARTVARSSRFRRATVRAAIVRACPRGISFAACKLSRGIRARGAGTLWLDHA